jgi:hypothetical protein
MKKWTSDFYSEKQEDNLNALEMELDNIDMDEVTYERKKFEVWKILEAHLKEQVKNELQNVQEKIDRLNNQKTILYRISLAQDELDKFKPSKGMSEHFKVVLVLYNK